MNTNLKSIYHKVDLCVVGGGLAGMCAAVAAARHGIKVALMHDRPVYGGNASSESECGCAVHTVKTTEKQALLRKLHLKPCTEILTDVIRCGDAILFELINNEKNITPILNCSC